MPAGQGCDPRSRPAQWCNEDLYSAPIVMDSRTAGSATGFSFAPNKKNFNVDQPFPALSSLTLMERKLDGVISV